MTIPDPDHQRKLDELRDKFEDELDKSYGDGIGHFAYGANTRHVADMALEYMTQASLYKNPMPTTSTRTNEELATECLYAKITGSSCPEMVGKMSIRDYSDIEKMVKRALDAKDRSWIDVVNAQQENIEALERLARALKEKCNSPTTPPL